MGNNINRRITIEADHNQAGNSFSRFADRIASMFGRASEAVESMNDNIEDSSSNITEMFDRIRMDSDEMFDSMIQDSEEYSRSVDDRVELMRRELELLQRASREEYQRGRIREEMALREAQARHSSGDMSDEDYSTARRRYQQSIQNLNSNRNVDNIRNTNIGNRLNDFERDNSNDDQQSGGNRYVAAAKAAPGQALRATLNSLGLMSLLTVSGFVGKMIAEGKQLDESESSTRGLGSRGLSGSGAAYGMKRAEFLNYARGTLIAAGDRDYDAVGNLAVEKRFSLGQGSLNGLTSQLRTERSGRNAQTAVLEMLSIFKDSDLFDVKSGDFTQAGEKIGFLTSMMEQQGQQMYETNSTVASNLIASFGRAGIDDQRMMGYSNPMNQSIMNPSNDFTKAFLFRSMKRVNPDASLLDMLKIQEEGIYGEGTLGGIVGDLKKNFKGDQLTMNVAKMFGLKHFQAERVLKMDEGGLNNIRSIDDINNPVSLSDGKGGAGAVSRRMAQVNDWFAKNGVKAIRKIDGYISSFEKDGFNGLATSLFSDLGDVLSSSITKLGETISESLEYENFSKFFLGEQEEKSKRINEEFKESGLTTNVLDGLFYKSKSHGKKSEIIDKNYNPDEITKGYDEPLGYNIYGFSAWGKDGMTIGNDDHAVKMNISQERAKELSGRQFSEVHKYARDNDVKSLSSEQVESIVSETNNMVKGLETKNMEEYLKQLRDLIENQNMTTEKAITKLQNQYYYGG